MHRPVKLNTDLPDMPSTPQGITSKMTKRKEKIVKPPRKIKAHPLEIDRATGEQITPNVHISWQRLQSETQIFKQELGALRLSFPGLKELNLVNNVICLTVEPLILTETEEPRPEQNDYLDLKSLVSHLKTQSIEYSYQPTKFSGLTYRFVPTPSLLKQLQLKTGLKKLKHITFLCFQSGQLVIVGLKTCDMLILKRLIIEFLEALSASNSFKIPVLVGPKISNMVFSFAIAEGASKTLSLYKFAQADLARDHVQYYPSLFPGAKLLVPNSSAICTLFTSRKAIFTGGGGFNIFYFKQAITLLSTILSSMGINIEQANFS